MQPLFPNVRTPWETFMQEEFYKAQFSCIDKILKNILSFYKYPFPPKNIHT